MAKLSFVVALVALVAAASSAKTKKPKVYRQTCVDAFNQPRPEGSTWLEGLNGCLRLTCTAGVVVGVDSCMCTYPDGTLGKTLDVWYSVPTCQSCKCNFGVATCDTLLNCLLPPTTTVVPVPSAGYTCTGPEGLIMNPGDMYIEGCQNCTCTATGLNCFGSVVCPVVPVIPEEVIDGSCYMGWLGVISATTIADEFVDNGFVFNDGMNVCTCTDGVFICIYTPPMPTPTVMPPVVVEPTEDASLDCDVGVGIVVNGETMVNDCGVTCTCVDGELECPECPVMTTDVEPTPTVEPPTPYVCVAATGDTVENGGSYLADKCTNCTCINGVFTCFKICERDCTTTSGKAVAHGGSYKTKCLSCKCKDATLTCADTCAGKTCSVPNSKTTIAPGKSKAVDKCNTCKCTSSIVLQCTSKCEPPTTVCVCDGRIVRSGKYTKPKKCQTCKCKAGKLTCKKTC